MLGKEIFFFPCLCVCREEEDPQCHLKWHRLRFFFLTIDETALFWTKHVVSFKKK
jgi:hypothetical protein